MTSSPISSWQIDGEMMETVIDFIFLGSKISIKLALRKLLVEMLISPRFSSALLQAGDLTASDDPSPISEWIRAGDSSCSSGCLGHLISGHDQPALSLEPDQGYVPVTRY